MTNLKNIYLNDINRTIQGVIKVDDTNYIKQELEEYVVTEELKKHFNKFFDAYEKCLNNEHVENIGVWISGFFGSGKSHFLKILSYLLENSEIEGKHVVDYFKDKFDDELYKKVKKCAESENDVILFDIDTKAGKDNGINSKLLDVFEWVFNEKNNLSTKPFVAEIEREMIDKGKYEEFLSKYNEISGLNWFDRRNALPIDGKIFCEAYSKVFNSTEEDARDILRLTEKTYNLNIEDFAKRVRKYIEKNNKKHVVFLIDEIGQYIGDNSQLMLNLQSIVQEFAVQCGGKVWIAVTSQMAIDDFIKVKGMDFSKIQGRFDTKLSLTSSNVDEVIEKRILAKTDSATDELKIIYNQRESIIRNLLTFTNAAYQKLYSDGDEFAKDYPFVPYQFDLLQNVFDNIRIHGYAGKHLAHGERSLINGFQKTAQEFENHEIGTIIPFYSFYDTIEEFLESQIQGVINKAKEAVKANVLKDMDINVLKMLFMLKDIKEIPSNIDNLSTLYVSNIDDDKLDIKNQIIESVKRLEGQTLIQRTNDTYKFLTNEEQAINRDIKNIDIDANEINSFIKKMVYDYELVDTKITYKSKPFSITKYIDNTKYTQEYDIGVKVVTNLSYSDETEILMKSAGEENYVFIQLDISTNLYEEIKNILQVSEYRRQKSVIYQSEDIEDIIRAKQREAEKSEENIKGIVKDLLSHSKIFVAGDEQNIKISDPKARLNEALIIVINNIYTRFNYIEHNFNIQNIKDLFHKTQEGLIDDKSLLANPKAYDAMKDYILEKEQYNFPVTINILLADFRKPPFGFIDEDILYILTRLLKDDVISLIYRNELQSLNNEDTLNKILRREYYDQTLIKIRTKMPKELVDGLKQISRDYFNILDLRDDEDGMIEDFKEFCLNSTIDKLNRISGNYRFGEKYQYPGRDLVVEGNNLLEDIYKIRDPRAFFEKVNNEKDNLKEILPEIKLVLDFFNSADGIQRNQFDEAVKIITIYDNNEDYINKNDTLTENVTKIKSILNDEKPYSKIHELPELKKELINILSEMYDKESAPTIESIKATKQYFVDEINSNKLDTSDFKSYIDSCDKAIECLETSNELKDIDAQKGRIDRVKEAFVKAIVESKLKKDASSKPDNNKEVVTTKYINTDQLFSHPHTISNEQELDIYLKELKDKLLVELNEHKNIIIK